jgi:hypothetical protein
VLYRVLKPGVRQATSGGGFRCAKVGDRITVSETGARPLIARGFLEVDAPAPSAPLTVGQAEAVLELAEVKHA